MYQKRKKISKAEQIMFQADRICCVCRTPDKSVQIHHIDKNSSNNSPDNLAVLCLECHNEAHVTGGFGRGLDARTIIKYRNDWNERVQKKRESNEDISTEIEIGLDKDVYAKDIGILWSQRADIPVSYEVVYIKGQLLAESSKGMNNVRKYYELFRTRDGLFYVYINTIYNTDYSLKHYEYGVLSQLALKLALMSQNYL